MNTLEILIQAIQNRLPISFEYNKPDKMKGKRFGHPYAVFIYTAKNAKIQSTKVHILQNGGVSDSKTEIELSNDPEFRMFNIEELSNVSIDKNKPPFLEPYNEKYNAEWDGYKDVIAKV